MDVQLRAAERSDLPSLLPFVDAQLKLQGRPFNLFRVEQALLPLLAGDPARRIWLIEARQSPAGYAAVCLCHSVAAGGCTALVDQFFVDESVRGRGIDGSALRLLLDQAREAGAVAVQLRAGDDADALRRLCTAVSGQEAEVVPLLELGLVSEVSPRR